MKKLLIFIICLGISTRLVSATATSTIVPDLIINSFKTAGTKCVHSVAGLLATTTADCGSGSSGGLATSSPFSANMIPFVLDSNTLQGNSGLTFTTSTQTLNFINASGTNLTLIGYIQGSAFDPSGIKYVTSSGSSVEAGWRTNNPFVYLTTSTQSVGIGATSSVAKLFVQGSNVASTSLLIQSMTAQTGALLNIATSGLSFLNVSSTGQILIVARPETTNALQITTAGGANVLSVDTTTSTTDIFEAYNNAGVLSFYITTSSPALTVASGTFQVNNTSTLLGGLSFVNASGTNISLTGYLGAANVSSTGITGNTLSIASSSGVVAAQITANGQFLATTTTASAAGYGFINDTNSGLFRVGAADIGMTTNGVLRWDIDSTDMVFTVPARGPAGAVNSPTYSWTGSNSDTGWFLNNTFNPALTTNGVIRLSVTTTDIQATVPLRGSAGSASAPSLSFSADTDTGLYSQAANSLGFTVGATELARLSSSTASLQLLNSAFLNSTGSIPTTSLCGTTPLNTGTNNWGYITVGSGVVSSCTLTFASSTIAPRWVNKPACVVSNESQNTVGGTTTSSTLVIAGTAIQGQVIHYNCAGLD